MEGNEIPGTLREAGGKRHPTAKTHHHLCVIYPFNNFVYQWFKMTEILDYSTYLLTLA